MNMQSYLASKYMSGPKADAILNRSATGKKKKRRTEEAPTASSASIIDDDGGWGSLRADNVENKDDEDVIVASDRSFKKRTELSESNWTTIRDVTPPPEADEMPLVVESASTPQFRGGLMTAAEMRKFDSMKKVDPITSPTGQEQETIYRDASGRKIDTKAERAEAARLKREREEREAQKMEWGKGYVQREEEERKKAQLAAESARDLARYADDTDLNDNQKAEQRWNDPAAAFLTQTRKKGPRKPEYQGPTPPPNRFNIKPGYRWDAVDRGNGFEKKLFQKANERTRKGATSHDWSVEDM